MKANELKDLYAISLRKMHNGEKRIVDALPAMAENASHDELRSAFESHLEESGQHQRRLEEILRDFKQAPAEPQNQAIAAAIKDGEAVITADAQADVKDAGLIAAAQQIEHVEIACYGTLGTYAELLDRPEDLHLLQQTLSEEKSADDKLNDIAKRVVNPNAQPA